MKKETAGSDIQYEFYLFFHSYEWKFGGQTIALFHDPVSYRRIGKTGREIKNLFKQTSVQDDIHNMRHTSPKTGRIQKSYSFTTIIYMVSDAISFACNIHNHLSSRIRVILKLEKNV